MVENQDPIGRFNQGRFHCQISRFALMRWLALWIQLHALIGASQVGTTVQPAPPPMTLDGSGNDAQGVTLC
jgi:hypothetical protein